MPTFLVTGATGRQGRATVDALLARGAKVHAIVRDTTKAAAQELENLGVSLFKGDHDHPDTFHQAAQGCVGIFLNLIERPRNAEPDKQAEGILAICKEAGVEHVVVSTAGWAESREKWDTPENQAGGLIDYYEGEALVEDTVRRSGLKSYTIIRPFWFQSIYLPGPVMDWYYPEFRESGTLVHSFEPGVTLPHINVEDIGQFVAMALLDPAKFAGEEIELASENLSIEGVAEVIGKVVGKQITIVRAAVEEPGKPRNSAKWHTLANSVDLKVDAEGLAQRYAYRFTTLKEYLVKENERQGLQYFD
ncbi:NmrA family protein [Xylaria digitata]|nr:NmrA family protein [Xylaria digitata]